MEARFNKCPEIWFSRHWKGLVRTLAEKGLNSLHTSMRRSSQGNVWVHATIAQHKSWGDTCWFFSLPPLPQACTWAHFLSMCQFNVVSVQFTCSLYVSICKVICRLQKYTNIVSTEGRIRYKGQAKPKKNANWIQSTNKNQTKSQQSQQKPTKANKSQQKLQKPQEPHWKAINKTKKHNRNTLPRKPAASSIRNKKVGGLFHGAQFCNLPA